MWLPLAEFTDYNETVFSIDNHRVFSNKSSSYHHTRVKLIFLKSGVAFVPYIRELVQC